MTHIPALLNLFIFPNACICSTMAFPPLGNSDQVVLSVSIDFLSNSQWDAQFHHIAYDYSHANWDGPDPDGDWDGPDLLGFQTVILIVLLFWIYSFF